QSAQHRHALALETEATSRLSAFRNLYATVAAVDGWALDVPPKWGKNHGNRHPAIQIGALALEERMRADGEKYVEVAGGATAHARFAFAREPYAGAALAPRRNAHRPGTLRRP